MRSRPGCFALRQNHIYEDRLDHDGDGDDDGVGDDDDGGNGGGGDGDVGLCEKS